MLQSDIRYLSSNWICCKFNICLISNSNSVSGDTEMCINPMHYNILETTAAASKSPVSARKSPLKPKSNNKTPCTNQNQLKLHDKEKEPPEDSDSDFLSDESDEDSVDWVEKWRTESILPDVAGPQKVGFFLLFFYHICSKCHFQEILSEIS